MKKIRLNSFTLLELMMYLSLASVIVFSITILVANTLQLREKNRAIFEVESQGALLMERLAQIIKYADDITSPLSGETASALTAQVSDTLSNPIIISASDDKITIKEGAGGTVDLISSGLEIKDLQFQNLSFSPDLADEIRISFTLDYKTQEKRGGFQYERSFFGSASVRSYPRDEN